MDFCGACCPNCFLFPPPPPASTEPTALRNLLPAGTIFLPILAGPEQEVCDHKHAEDGWHEFRAQKFVGLLSEPKDVAFCNGLQFLIHHNFIRVTHRNNYDGVVAFRVYLIPDDLPGMGGKLRTRPSNILPAARRHLQTLLTRIITHRRIWDGAALTTIPRNEICRLLVVDKDSTLSLPEIYSNLSSPHPLAVPGYGEIASRLLDFDDPLEGLGLRSRLYTYQRRSVAAMLQKELDRNDVPDPLYVPLPTVTGKNFYFQPGTMEILLERPSIAPCRGGILCEELGTGKTVMMLGLIAATRGQISSPEPSIIENRPILTPLAFRHFPSSDYAEARRLLDVRQHNEVRVPSLVELLVHRARTNPQCDVPRSESGRAYEHEQHVMDTIANSDLGKPIQANVPFYFQGNNEPRATPSRSERTAPPAAPRVLYLTSATLVVVPSNLVSQWDREILKHCDVPLRVLIVRPKTPLPSVHSLATDYDIVLMPYTRFTSESKHANIAKLHERRVCTCPEHHTIRVPDCSCHSSSTDDDTSVSPLLRIRWKRLVIDEGHISSSLTTSLVPFAKLLSVERRWIITGTPTTNLLGLSFGSKTVVEDAGATEAFGEHSVGVTTTTTTTSTPEGSVVSTPQASPSKKSNIGSGPQSPENSTPDEPPAPNHTHTQSTPGGIRRWTRWDRQDLTKLGNMITHFIRVPQFHSCPKLVSSHIVEPLLDAQGPRGGSVDVLRQVMEMVMIRHRIEDVEKDVVLPPVAREAVLLDLDPLVVKSFNALQAIILINAVDSQRRDQDYMFHPQNVGALAETVQNMSQILFWHIDGDKYNAPALVRDADAIIQRAVERGMPEKDITGLVNAFSHLKIALDDPLWQQIQSHEDVPYRVFDLQEPIFRGWSRTRSPELGGDASQTGMVHADRLLRLHDLIVQKPLMSVDDIADYGRRVDIHDTNQREAYERAMAKQERRRTSHPLKQSDSDAVSAKLLADEFSKKASSSETMQEMQKELLESLKRIEMEDMEEGDVDIENGHASASAPSMTFDRPILASSHLAKLRVGSSASTKINYIINEVRTYAKDEKILIFSASPLSLAHIAEALELIHVKFLRFTTQIPPHLREQLVLTFETSEMYRVFLMELKHGARGLNLISASRVIFCEPVWQADVESQAIKRVHRIGQTRSVNVKTLAIRDTAEEQMVNRRGALNLATQLEGKTPKLLEEKGMRDYIQNPTFITRLPVTISVPQFPLLNLPPEALRPRPGALTLKIPPLHPPPPKRRITLGPPCDTNEEPQHKKKKLNFGAEKVATFDVSKIGDLTVDPSLEGFAHAAAIT